MASLQGSIQNIRKNAAWFTSNASRVLLDGQVAYLAGTGETKYKIGDGVTALSALPWSVDSIETALSSKADLVGGFVPSGQLPSFVDDVLEYANFAALPGTGAAGKIYVTLDDNKTYRWSGSAYVLISDTIVLGELSTTAYRGDRGKTAYDHSQVTGNPHGTGIDDITGLQSALDALVVSYNKSFLKQNTSVNHTGTTAETVLFSGLIPAGTLLSNDIIKFFIGLGATNSVNQKTFRIRFHTSAGVVGSAVPSGTTLAGTYQISTNGIQGAMGRVMVSQGAINSWRILSATTSLNNEYSLTPQASTILTTDFSVDQYFIITVELQNSSESGYLLHIQSEICR